MTVDVPSMPKRIHDPDPKRNAVEIKNEFGLYYNEILRLNEWWEGGVCVCFYLASDGGSVESSLL